MLLSESTELTAIHRRILALTFVGWMFDYYDLILYTFLTRFISEDPRFALGLSAHAWNLGLSFASTAVGGVASGYLADRFGRRTVIGWTILLYSFGALLSGLATNPLELAIGRAVVGLGVGGEWAAGHTLVAETFPPALRGRAGALLQTGAPVGVGLALLVGTLVAPRIGWQNCFLLSSATAALAFVVRRALPESDLWLSGKTKRFGVGVKGLFAGALAPKFYLTLLLTTVSGAAYMLTYTWMPEYMRRRYVDLSTSGRFMSVLVLGEIVGYACFGVVSDRIGRRVAFTAFSLLMAMGLLPLTVLWERFAVSPWPIVASLAVVGFGTGTWSNFGPMLSELFRTEVRNTALGTVFNLSRFFMVGTQWLIVWLADPVKGVAKTNGLAAGIGLAAGFAALSSILVWTLPETRGASLD